MLTIAPEQLRRVIDGARRLEQVRAGLEPVLPAAAGERPPAGPWHDGIEMYMESPTRRAFTTALADIPPDQQAELIALMWLGRGDPGTAPSRWQDLLVEARLTARSANVAALVGVNRLSHYLEAGLARLAGRAQAG